MSVAASPSRSLSHIRLPGLLRALKRPYTFAFAIAGVLALTGLAYLSISESQQTARATDWVSHSYQVLRVLMNLVESQERAQTVARGYMLTGDAALLRQYQQETTAAKRYAWQVRNMTVDNPRQCTIAGQIGQNLNIIADATQHAMTKGRGATWHDIENTRTLMVQLRSRIADMQQEEDHLLQSRLDRWARSSRALQVSILGLTALMVLGALVAFWFFKKHNDELKHLNGELFRANRAKDAFLATMSHELRTPLNSIIGFNGILLMGLPGDLNDTQTRQLQYVQQAAQHLLSLINDILDLARIESGNAKLYLKNIKLADLLDKVIRSLEPQAGVKHLYLHVQFQGPDDVLADERSLKQILTNLISNAIKYTETGGVTVQTRCDHGSVEVIVTDTGAGIGRPDLSRIFDEYIQLDAERKQEGTGLGLMLSQKLAHLMNGNITVQSEIGKGSTFTLTIPQAGR